MPSENPISNDGNDSSSEKKEQHGSKIVFLRCDEFMASAKKTIASITSMMNKITKLKALYMYGH